MPRSGLERSLSSTLVWEFTVSRSLADTVIDASRVRQVSRNAVYFKRLVQRILGMIHDVQYMLPWNALIRVGFLKTEPCPTIVIWINLTRDHLPVNSTVLFSKMEDLVDGMRRTDALELPKTFRIAWLTKKTRRLIRLETDEWWETGEEIVERQWQLGEDYFGVFDLCEFLRNGR